MKNVARYSQENFRELAGELLHENLSGFMAEHDNRRDSIMGGFQRLFEEWRKCSVDDCSWLTIIDALKNVDNVPLANMIEDYFQPLEQ